MTLAVSGPGSRSNGATMICWASTCHAASSLASGTSSTELDFASVQRGNPEMERRAQEVIDRCWQMGGDNPILLIHDVGAGGLSNAVPEAVDHSQHGAEIELREVDNAEPGMQFIERVPWVETFNVWYYLGVDGISAPLILLTTFITPLVVVAGWDTIRNRPAQYMAAFLVMEGLMIGVFSALDGLLFYVFWEVMLLPMYLLIGVWGSPARRIYAAVKFFLYTMFGSLLMMVAILVLYFYNYNVTGVYTFDIEQLYQLSIPYGTQIWLFLAFALAFAHVPFCPPLFFQIRHGIEINILIRSLPRVQHGCAI